MSSKRPSSSQQQQPQQPQQKKTANQQQQHVTVEDSDEDEDLPELVGSDEEDDDDDENNGNSNSSDGSGEEKKPITRPPSSVAPTTTATTTTTTTKALQKSSPTKPAEPSFETTLPGLQGALNKASPPARIKAAAPEQVPQVNTSNSLAAKSKSSAVVSTKNLTAPAIVDDDNDADMPLLVDTDSDPEEEDEAGAGTAEPAGAGRGGEGKKKKKRPKKKKKTTTAANTSTVAGQQIPPTPSTATTTVTTTTSPTTPAELTTATTVPPQSTEQQQVGVGDAVSRGRDRELFAAELEWSMAREAAVAAQLLGEHSGVRVDSRHRPQLQGGGGGGAASNAASTAESEVWGYPPADSLSARALFAADNKTPLNNNINNDDGDDGDDGELPPPPLESLAVERNTVLGVFLERPPSKLAARKGGLFQPACEALTYLHSELGQTLTRAYLNAPRFLRAPHEEGDAVGLNPYRMRALSAHSWWLLLLLEKARLPPPASGRYLFSEDSSRDEHCVLGFEESSPRDQLRRMGWFGYDADASKVVRRAASNTSTTAVGGGGATTAASVSSVGAAEEGALLFREVPRSAPAEVREARRVAVRAAASVASQYMRAHKLFEAAHVLEEAVALCRSLPRQQQAPLHKAGTTTTPNVSLEGGGGDQALSNGGAQLSSGSNDDITGMTAGAGSEEGDAALLLRLVAEQFDCLSRLDRRTEGFRLLDRLKIHRLHLPPLQQQGDNSRYSIVTPV